MNHDSLIFISFMKGTFLHVKHIHLHPKNVLKRRVYRQIWGTVIKPACVESSFRMFSQFRKKENNEISLHQNRLQSSKKVSKVLVKKCDVCSDFLRIKFKLYLVMLSQYFSIVFCHAPLPPPLGGQKHFHPLHP